jgi:serine/threonine protein kinase
MAGETGGNMQGLIGLRVGEYRIIEPIDRGSFFEVYKSEHVNVPENYVATRLLRLNTLNPQSLSQFKNEISLLTQLTHPNIVQVVSIGIIEGNENYDGYPFMHLRYISGGTLTAFVESSGLPSEETLLSIAKDTLEGLVYIHSKGVLHRDIHEKNILLEKGIAYLADFGMAKHMERYGYSKSYTGVWSKYSPPEHSEDYDERTDIFQLGATLYHGATGHQIGHRAPEIAQINKNISPELINIIDRALEPLPQARYQNAFDMLSAVTELINSNEAYIQYLAELEEMTSAKLLLTPSQIHHAYGIIAKAKNWHRLNEMEQILVNKKNSDLHTIENLLLGTSKVPSNTQKARTVVLELKNILETVRAYGKYE